MTRQKLFGRSRIIIQLLTLFLFHCWLHLTPYYKIQLFTGNEMLLLYDAADIFCTRNLNRLYVLFTPWWWMFRSHIFRLIVIWRLIGSFTLHQLTHLYFHAWVFRFARVEDNLVELFVRNFFGYSCVWSLLATASLSSTKITFYY